MNPLQRNDSSSSQYSQDQNDPGQQRVHSAQVADFADIAAANPWGGEEEERSVRLQVPDDDRPRSGSIGGSSSQQMFAAVSRDHPGVLPVLEGEVAGPDAQERIQDGFTGRKHYEKFAGDLTSHDNHGIINAAENSGRMALTRNGNALTITNNDGEVSSRGAQQGAMEHIETQSGLYHVAGRSDGRHNIINNRQTVQIGDRDGPGLGEHGVVSVGGYGKVEFWHPNKNEPEIHHLNGSTMTFTRQGAPNILQRASNWAANNPGKAGALGATAATVAAAGTHAIYVNNAAAIVPSVDAAHKVVQGTTSAVSSAASSEAARAARTATAAAEAVTESAAHLKFPGR